MLQVHHLLQIGMLHMILLLVSAGQKMFEWFGRPISQFALWTARGSHYWRKKWIASEVNITNRRYINNYLCSDECNKLCFLQRELKYGTYKKRKYTKQWEYFRLLAVMEAANDGSQFAKELFLDAINPLLAIKLSLDQPLQLLLELMDRLENNIPSTILPQPSQERSGFIDSKNEKDLLK